jgi:hypothetical protein
LPRAIAWLATFCVCCRNGQVDHDLYIRVVEHGGDITGGSDVVLSRLLLGGLGDNVADRTDLGIGEPREVLQ